MQIHPLQQSIDIKKLSNQQTEHTTITAMITLMKYVGATGVRWFLPFSTMIYFRKNRLDTR